MLTMHKLFIVYEAEGSARAPKAHPLVSLKNCSTISNDLI